MSSRTAVRQRPIVPQKNLAAPAVGIQSAMRTEAAANDEQQKPGFAPSSDPLIGMAIASVILFGVLAALIAFS